MAATWGAGRGRQSERVSASQPGWACARALPEGRPAACRGPGPAVPLRADARRLRCRCEWPPSPLPCAAGSELSGGTTPSPPAGDPSSPAARGPRSPPGHPPAQEWFGPQSHQCLFSTSGSHTDCDALPPRRPLEWPGAEPRLQPGSTNPRPALGASFAFPGAAAQWEGGTHRPPEGAVLPVDCTTLGTRRRGEKARLPESRGQKGVSPLSAGWRGQRKRGFWSWKRPSSPLSGLGSLMSFWICRGSQGFPFPQQIHFHLPRQPPPPQPPGSNWPNSPPLPSRRLLVVSLSPQLPGVVPDYLSPGPTLPASTTEGD